MQMWHSSLGGGVANSFESSVEALLALVGVVVMMMSVIVRNHDCLTIKNAASGNWKQSEYHKIDANTKREVVCGCGYHMWMWRRETGRLTWILQIWCTFYIILKMTNNIIMLRSSSKLFWFVVQRKRTYHRQQWPAKIKDRQWSDDAVMRWLDRLLAPTC